MIHDDYYYSFKNYIISYFVDWIHNLTPKFKSIHLKIKLIMNAYHAETVEIPNVEFIIDNQHNRHQHTSYIDILTPFMPYNTFEQNNIKLIIEEISNQNYNECIYPLCHYIMSKMVDDDYISFTKCLQLINSYCDLHNTNISVSANITNNIYINS